MAEYKLLKTEGRAKRAEFHTVHGTIQTPVFMNVDDRRNQGCRIYHGFTADRNTGRIIKYLSSSCAPG